MDKLKVEYLKICDLTPYSRNTRKHDKEDVETIMKSIEQCGFNDPVGIWGDDNTIVEGHGRIMAAKKLGIKEVPCIRLDHMTDEERRKYAILHNATAELSIWDRENLNLELPELDMSGFDFYFGVDEEETEEFSIEDMQEIEGYDPTADNRQYFQSSFTFPIEKRDAIISYLATHKAEIVQKIIDECDRIDGDAL